MKKLCTKKMSIIVLALLPFFGLLFGLSPAITAVHASFPVVQDKVEFVDTNSEPVEAPAGNIDWTAFGLCLFGLLFGLCGLHRFYMGDIGIGIAQLLTLGGCGIWQLIDFIRILTGDLYG